MELEDQQIQRVVHGKGDMAPETVEVEHAVHGKGGMEV